MTNLLKETIKTLERYDKSFDDVEWIGTRKATIPIDLFVKLADKEYDSSYGSPKVVEDLLVCGDDWHLERAEYDGAEWWEFRTQPKRPDKVVYPAAIVDDAFMWETLETAIKLKGEHQNEKQK